MRVHNLVWRCLVILFFCWAVLVGPGVIAAAQPQLFPGQKEPPPGFIKSQWVPRDKEREKLARGGSAITLDGSLSVQSFAKEVLVRDNHSGRFLKAAIPAHDVMFSAFSPDNKTLFVSSRHSDIEAWDVGTKQLLYTLPRSGKLNPITSFSVSPNNKTFVCLLNTGLRFWDLTNRQEVKLPFLKVDNQDRLGWAGFTVTGHLIVHGFSTLEGDSPGWLTVRDGVTGELLQIFSEKQFFRYSHCRLSEDGRFLLALAAKPKNPFAEADPRAFQTKHLVIPEWHVCVWEVASGQKIFLSSRVEQWWFAASPNGFLYTFNDDKRRIIVRDLCSDKEQVVAPGGHAWTFLDHGKTLLTSHSFEDGFWNCYWDVATILKAAPQQPKPAAPELNQLWTDLAGDDAPKARKAVWQLVQAPALSVPLLQKHLQPVPPLGDKVIAGWIEQLDSQIFKEREKAIKQLKDHLPQATKAIKAALIKPKSLEQKQRLEALAKLFTDFYSGERLRRLRAIEVLERIGTAEAQKVLEHVASGDPLAPETQDAKAAVQRVQKNPAN